MITANHIDYLRGLVRKEIAWRQTMIDNFEARPGQTEREADEICAKIERSMRYGQKVLIELDKLHERASKTLDRDLVAS